MSFSNISPFSVPTTHFLVLRYEAQQLLIARPSSYDDLQREIRRHFPNIPADHRVSYHTDEMAVSKGALVEVSPDAWDAVIPQLSALTVQSAPHFTFWDNPAPPVQPAHRCGFLGMRGPDQSLQKQQPEPDSFIDLTNGDEPKLVLKLRILLSSKTFHFTCPASMPVGDIISRCLPEMGLDSSGRHTVRFNNSLIWSKMRNTLEEFGLKDGDQVDVVPETKFAKPVIYLLPPAGSEIDASVTLSLIPHWKFSAIYPVVPVVTGVSQAQQLRWEVRAAADGLLLEKQTGLEVAYLYWEAEPLARGVITSSSITHTGPSNPGANTENDSLDAKFIPTEAQLKPSDSVVLKVEHITPYLDSALKALGLHTEARTSFMTYWLPSFLRHKFVALRFLPQSQYEHAAPLEVDPKPGVILRVFMLFMGLPEDQVADEGWNMADVNDATRWRNVVGVDDKISLTDMSLFRVIEWGGMELH